MELRQGDMTLAELRQKFEHLAQFAPTLVSTPAYRIEEFRKRLRPDMRPYVSTVITTDFSEANDLMAKVEKDVDDLKASMNAGGVGCNTQTRITQTRETADRDLDYAEIESIARTENKSTKSNEQRIKLSQNTKSTNQSGGDRRSAWQRCNSTARMADAGSGGGVQWRGGSSSQRSRTEEQLR
ncbi:unnamed protein product [Cuscuta campestris]|uniref:Retrotransposon gag domain-containing protein n=1 Tax=Cuscuta campestris TaxID=132261 RepID=A0A484M168_9ASTE|nr:unnamed protein product [Cuscuta campestris]